MDWSLVDVTALSDLLNEAKDQGRNIDHWVEQSEEAGCKINRATVYKALNGEHAKNPSEQVLRGLAFVFDVDIRDLRVAAGKPRGELGEWIPTTESSRLSQEQREALDALIKAIVREGGQAHGNAAATSEGPSGPAPVVPIKRAARKVDRKPSNQE